MNENKLHESVNQILDRELDEIDIKTLEKLRAIRREAVNSIADTAMENQYQQGNLISLSMKSVWRYKKWIFTSLVFSICILLVVAQSIKKQNNDIELPLDFSIYTEVDPDWLTDMEIADTFGDD